MVFQVPASKASIKQNVFEFSLPDDERVWSIPKAQHLNSELMLDMQTEITALQPLIASGAKPTPEQSQSMMRVQMRVLKHYCPGLLELIDNDQMLSILEGWQQASNGPTGVGLGES